MLNILLRAPKERLVPRGNEAIPDSLEPMESQDKKVLEASGVSRVTLVPLESVAARETAVRRVTRACLA